LIGLVGSLIFQRKDIAKQEADLPASEVDLLTTEIAE
ncbi:hypothetical protein CGSMWGv00703Dmash_02420, partial [Gardnerella greenwoodii 00703Dmash]